MRQTFALLGKPVRGTIAPGEMETFPAPAGVDVVAFETNELTAICPVTDQPDLYHLLFVYRPHDRCLESKSLKLYLHSFRDRGMFAEALAGQLLADLTAVLSPPAATVRLRQQVRGGLTLTALAHHGGGCDLS